MRTAHLATVRASVSIPPDVSTGGRGVNFQVNKFEQGVSDCHQMSLLGRGAHVSCPGARPSIVRSNVSWMMVTWVTRSCGQTDTYDRKHCLFAASLASGKNDKHQRKFSLSLALNGPQQEYNRIMCTSS